MVVLLKVSKCFETENVSTWGGSKYDLVISGKHNENLSNHTYRGTWHFNDIYFSFIFMVAIGPYYIYSFLRTLGPRQNGRHFADNPFKCIFLNENVWILLKISLKFVLKCPIHKNPALVQRMAWHHSGNKPWSEPVMVSLLTHISVTRLQWVNIYCHVIPLIYVL